MELQPKRDRALSIKAKEQAMRLKTAISRRIERSLFHENWGHGGLSEEYHMRLINAEVQSSSLADLDIEIEPEGLMEEQASLRITADKDLYALTTFYERFKNRFLGFQSDQDILDFRIAEKLNDLQSQEHTSKSGLIRYIRAGRIEYVKARLSSLENAADRRDLVNFRDAVGANAIHAAYLYQEYEIARYLVMNFPDLGIEPYATQCNIPGLESMRLPYAGETILHMAIISKNYAEIRWILDFYRLRKGAIVREDGDSTGLQRLLRSQVNGPFFDIGKESYFGETPLHFAAGTNSIPIFDLVLNFVVTEFPAALFLRDSHGNNLFHLCVLKGLDKMYHHIRERAIEELKTLVNDSLQEEKLHRKLDKVSPTLATFQLKLTLPENYAGCSRRVTPLPFPAEEEIGDDRRLKEWVTRHARIKLFELLGKTLNDEGHTPLTLAAKENQIKMFSFMLNESRNIRYTFGPITVSLFDLDSLEIPVEPTLYQAAPMGNLRSAIEWLCISNSRRGLSEGLAVFSNPIIKSLIETKWNRIGRPFFFKAGLRSIAITVLVTMILVMHNYRAHVLNNKTPQQKYATSLYVITGLILLYDFIGEVPCLIASGLDYWGIFGGIRGAPRLDKLCFTVTTMSFISACVSKGVYSSIVAPTDDFQMPNNYLQATEYSLIICVLSAYMNIYYYLMGIDATGPFVLTLYKIISQDVPYFFRFYFVFLLAIGCALALITSDNTLSVSSSYSHLIQSWWGLVHALVQFSDDFQVENTTAGMEWMYDFLRTLFSVVSNILMLNLLIAMMNLTYSTYISNSGNILLLEKYNIMCAMQRSRHAAHYTLGRWRHLLPPYFQAMSDSLRAKLSPEYELKKYAVREKTLKYHHTWWYHKMEEVNHDKWHNEEINVKPESFINHSLGVSDPLKIISHKAFKNTLVIVDPQNDFHKNGSLAVNGADEDSERIAEMIISNKYDIDEIYVTLDTHQNYAIGFPLFWVNPAGEQPSVNTVITYEDIKSGKWAPKDASLQKYVQEYALKLRIKGKFEINIWPYHCIRGSHGHSVVPVIFDAIRHWSEKTSRSATWIVKGTNPLTEMYSALAAEVEIVGDKTTTFDMNLLAQLNLSDRVFICGQALSHCVNYTTRDLCDRMDPKKIFFLDDASSPVPGFEKVGEAFKMFLLSRGVTLTKTTEAFMDAKLHSKEEAQHLRS